MNTPHRTFACRRIVASWIAAFVLLIGAGCPPSPSPRGIESDVGDLPPREFADIVEAITANADRLDRALWSSSAHVTARFHDEKGREHVYNLDSTLLLKGPRNLRMDLRPGLGEQVMQIGSNPDEYWVWVEADLRTMWWGRHDFVGQSCADPILVRPDELIAALGINGLPAPSAELIGPVRKYGKRVDILSFHKRDPMSNRWRLDREYWIDRRPPYQIRVVNTFDPYGRVSMSAYLDDYRPAWEGGPLLAHEISIFWPKEEGKFTLSIGRVRGMPDDKVQAGAFRRPERARLPAGVREHIIQVDAGCDAQTPAAVRADEP